MEDKRLIEVDFPLKEVSEESVREKLIRRGHISTIHAWWARRPLAASRAIAYSALTPAPQNSNELKRKLEFTAKLSKWENSLNRNLINQARKEIRDFFGGSPPRVLDCFAGGGAIPLEALRLGCETYASEYNPVAVLILKAILEYPQKYRADKNKAISGLTINDEKSRLVEDVKKWGQWILKEVKKEINRFYPADPDGSVPVGYIWARTIKCQNPSCGAEIPLLRQFWLAKTNNKKVALKLVPEKKTKIIKLRIIENKEIDFNPTQGTTSQATVLCPVCSAGIRGDNVRKEARKGRMGQKMIAVVLHNPNEVGKNYRVASERDFNVFKESEKYFEEKRDKLTEKLGFDPVPYEILPTPDRKEYVEGGLFYNFMPIVLYGMKKWGDLFNARQKLALITFMDFVKQAHERMLTENMEEEYASVVMSYLGLALDKLADTSNVLCKWKTDTVQAIPALGGSGRQALPIIWDYFELNPISGISRSWTNTIDVLLDSFRIIGDMYTPASVTQSSATSLSYPDNHFDAVLTDPPYYDNVPYCDLSDFFYVWLKRIIGDVHPDLFSTPLTPKSLEIIDDLSLLRGMAKDDASRSEKIRVKDRKFFENMITDSFREIHRVLRPDGIAVIVFAHKSTEAWETIINSLLKSGLVLVASWPIHTEMKTRLRAIESAALASSVYMVCRKRTKEKSAYFNELKEEIENRIKEKLTQFWEQGISGADFFVSAIGPAVEVFGKYSKVEKLSGEEVSVQELLEYVRKIVSEFALERVLKRADLGGVDAETRFYLLWRWTFGNAKVHFDDAIKLSRPMGVELTQLWDGGSLVKKEKEFIRVLAPQERAKDPAFLKKTKFTSMIDVLHYVLVLWERGEREKIKEILNETGYAGNEIFWQTTQAISEVLPQGDKEKQLLQGFLYGKEIYVKEARGKTSLLDYMESK